jgi:hypothetical protein
MTSVFMSACAQRRTDQERGSQFKSRLIGRCLVPAPIPTIKTGSINERTKDVPCLQHCTYEWRRCVIAYRQVHDRFGDAICEILDGLIYSSSVRTEVSA